MNEDLLDLNTEDTEAVVRPFFPKMIAISLALHVICAIIIAGGGKGRPGDPTINYLDLTMSEPPAAVSNPAVPPPELTTPAEDAVVPQAEQTPPPPTEAEKLRQEAQQAVKAAADQPEAMQKVSFGLGLLNGHFGTIADGRTLRNDMREYHLSLLRAINENWWRNGNKFEGVNSAIVNIMVSRSGEIINAQIMQSSGNPAYDRVLMKSLIDAGPLPPLPPQYESQVFTAPIKFNPPLTLFGSPSG
jgi:TonB family protein